MILKEALTGNIAAAVYVKMFKNSFAGNVKPQHVCVRERLY